jgi:small-conductance mechanosensitive channel
MFLDQEVYHNSVQQWLMALAVFVLSLMILKISTRVVYRRLKQLVQKTKTYIDDMLSDALARVKLFFLFALSLYFASLMLELPPTVSMIITKVVIIAMVIQSAIWVHSLITLWMNRYKLQKLQVDATGVTTFSVIGFVGKIILWSIVFLLILDNLGINITALVAGLGIGGIAIALAVQNILGDLIASFSIVFDKPFVIGDFIIIDTYMGTVEHIGLKTTRIRSLSGEQLILSNTDLLHSRISNYKRMNKRRVQFTLGVTYETASEKLEKVPAFLQEIISCQQNTQFERAHFKAFGDFALLFEVVYWVLSPDYNVYMDIQQNINYQIMDTFRKEQIDFAYPTQTVIMARQSMETEKN